MQIKFLKFNESPKLLAKLLYASIFVIIFSLISSCLSLYFQNQSYEIEEEISVIKKNQKAISDAQIVLVDALLLAKRDHIEAKIDLLDIEKLKKDIPICRLLLGPMTRASFEIKALVNIGQQVVLKESNFGHNLEQIHDRLNGLISLARSKHLDEICKEEGTANIVELSSQRIRDIQKLMDISLYLKETVDEQLIYAMKQSGDVKKHSRVSMLTAFVLQVLIFSLVSILDVKTFRMGDR